jgi:cysteine desulfurase
MDYQASTPVDPRVYEVMVPYFFDCPANPHALDHAFGWEANAALETATLKVASAIGANPDEIIFTSGATEANNLAILGLAARATSRRRILTSAIEHKSVLAPARAAADRFGLVIEQLPVDREGFLRLDVLREQLAEDVLLVSVMLVNNEIGTIQPLSDIAALCRQFGAFVHTDAVQALTAAPVDVDNLNVDLLSLSAHKLYGPKGIGALYVRRDVQPRIEPLIYGGAQQSDLRSGTLPVPLCAGFGEAAALLAAETATEERARIRALRDRFLSHLGRITSNMSLNGPNGNLRHPGNANVLLCGLDAQDVLAALQPKVAAATGSACTSGVSEPSHVLRAVGLSRSQAMSSIRFSLGRFTTADDIEESVQVLGEVLPRITAAA